MQKFLLLLTAVVISLVAEIALAQPRPFDSTPSDYVPRAVEELPGPEIQPAPQPVIVTYPPLPTSADGRFEQQPDISPNADKWRYVWYGGRWWYRQPTNRWTYWSEGRWVDYLPPARSNTPGYVQPPPPVRRRWQVANPTPFYR
jgi:hypothetical protein